MGRRSDHSREEISRMALDAAVEIVRQEGLSGLTARKVAAKIGYAPGTLYVVFRNQDELILNLNARTLDQLHLFLEEAVLHCGKPQDCILKLAHAYVAFAAEQANLWSAVFEHRLAEGEEGPLWYQEKIERLFLLVEGPLRQLDNGSSDSEVRLAANALWSGIHGVCTLRQVGSLERGGGREAAAIVESLVSHYLVGYASV
ncbi:MAG: TetR/AcrR family transcriptional regulator [Sedimenticola sp.]